MKEEVSGFIRGLVPWTYDVSGGFKLRGHFTPPSGKPVLHFLHGNGFNGLVYEKFLAPLSNHFDLFLSNAQGHGGSDVGKGFTHWDDSAGYFTEVWQHYSSLWNDVPRVGLGHSFGGVNTLLMANNDSMLFDRVIMLDPIIGSRAFTVAANGMQVLGLSKHLPLVKQARVRGTFWQDEESMWNYFYQRGTFKGWDDDCLRSYLKHGMNKTDRGFELKCPPAIESAIFASYSRSVWTALNNLQIPADMLFGANTYDFVRKTLPKLEKRYDLVNVHKVEGGHCFMQERPDVAADHVLSILLDIEQ